ncbi:acid protease [Saccharata proteae CBS 121410]|uniref:Acid protease n=1 Tax=Saccharata proteae CBS 121410 TaxID=1314787 RepID=A0A9P4HSV9_9PEZI|nr:acid protease [Saccharata proteae CBS 121410]
MDQSHANVQYFVDISLGLPPQVFRALVDLSWSDLFVPSSKCDDLACAAHSTYDSHLSETYKPADEQSDVSYFDRNGFGHVSQDTLRIGHLGIAHQSFHELDTLEREALPAWTPYFDAVLGLAPDNVSSSAALQNPFQSMMSQGLLDSNVIGLCLGSTEQPGEITFGGINANLYDGELARIPLTNVLNGTWQVQARAISWGVSPIENQVFSKYTAKLETASPYIYLPEEVYQEIKRLMKPSPGPLFPESIDCNRREHLPDITFDLGGNGFSLTPYQYTIEMSVAGHGKRCINTIRPLHKLHPQDKRVIILGSAFLRAYYTVLDFDRQELGRMYSNSLTLTALTELTKTAPPQ